MDVIETRRAYQQPLMDLINYVTCVAALDLSVHGVQNEGAEGVEGVVLRMAMEYGVRSRNGRLVEGHTPLANTSWKWT